MRTDGFVRRECRGIYYLSCRALENIPHIRHAFSLRHGGVSLPPEGILNLGFVPWDAPAHVNENRRRFLSALGLEQAHLIIVAQKHSAAFHIIKAPLDQWDRHTPGDAMTTLERDAALAVGVADCFPVLIADPGAGAIAAVHAGWRGTLGRILRQTLEAMQSNLGADLSRVIVALGPGIRPCCCEVGPEVSTEFEREFPNAPLLIPHPAHEGKYLLDLPRALNIQLSEAGVPPANVFDCGECTRCHPEEYFSFRAEGARTGRMMGIICRCADQNLP